MDYLHLRMIFLRYSLTGSGGESGGCSPWKHDSRNRKRIRDPWLAWGYTGV